MIKNCMITEILHKIADFSQECAHFREKYGDSLAHCKRAYETGKEHFEAYDEFMAWEFAEHGKAYWEPQLETIIPSSPARKRCPCRRHRTNAATPAE